MVEERDQVGRRVNEGFVAAEIIRRKSVPKTITRKTNPRFGIASRCEVNRRVADENDGRQRYTDQASEVHQTCRGGLPAEGRVSSNRLAEVLAQSKACQDTVGCISGLIGQDSQRHVRRERLKGFDHSWIWPRMLQQMPIVMSEKPIERIGSLRIETRRRQGSAHEHRGSFPYH